MKKRWILADSLYNRARMNRKMALELEKRKQVFELANDFFFEYDFSKDNLMVNVPGQQGKIQGSRILKVRKQSRKIRKR